MSVQDTMARRRRLWLWRWLRDEGGYSSRDEIVEAMVKVPGLITDSPGYYPVLGAANRARMSLGRQLQALVRDGHIVRKLNAQGADVYGVSTQCTAPKGA